MKISWLRPLRALYDVDIQLFAHKCFTTSGHQQWYFEDFTAKVEMRKHVYVVLNALRWVLHECKSQGAIITRASWNWTSPECTLFL
jgi:hypothetical protein